MEQLVLRKTKTNSKAIKLLIDIKWSERLFLDIVVGQRYSVLELFTRENEPLQISRDTLFFQDLFLLHLRTTVLYLT